MLFAFDIVKSIAGIIIGGYLLICYTALAATVMNDLEEKYFQKEE